MALVETGVGGRWSWPYFYPGITATIRARWQDRTSPPVRVRDRAFVLLRRLGGREFSIVVSAKVSFEGRRALLQGLDSARGWTTLSSVVLTESGVPPGSSTVFTSARVKATALIASLVRAYFPTAQAGPCYLPGRSNLLRLR